MSTIRLTDREEALFRLATDPGAPPGEASAAMLALLRLLRARGARLEDLRAGSRATPRPEPTPQPEPHPQPEDVDAAAWTWAKTHDVPHFGPEPDSAPHGMHGEPRLKPLRNWLVPLCVMCLAACLIVYLAWPRSQIAPVSSPQGSTASSKGDFNSRLDKWSMPGTRWYRPAWSSCTPVSWVDNYGNYAGGLTDSSIQELGITNPCPRPPGYTHRAP